MARSEKVLIIGSGSIAHRHARLLADMGFQLHHVSRSGRRLEVDNTAVIARERGDLGPGEFDLVVICSATQEHVSDLLEAVAWGGKILVEKPIATSETGLDSLRAVDWASLNAFVSQPLRFKFAYLELIDRVSSLESAPWRVKSVSSSWLPDWRPGRDFRDGYWNRQGSGGVLFELIHEPDYVSHLVGGFDVVKVIDRSSGVLAMSVPESVEVVATSQRAAHVSIHLDWCSPGERRSVRIETDDSWISWDLLRSCISSGSAGPSQPQYFPDDVERDNSFRRQYQEVFSPGSTGGTLCSVAESIRLTAKLVEASGRESDR